MHNLLFKLRAIATSAPISRIVTVAIKKAPPFSLPWGLAGVATSSQSQLQAYLIELMVTRSLVFQGALYFSALATLTLWITCRRLVALSWKEPSLWSPVPPFVRHYFWYGQLHKLRLSCEAPPITRNTTDLETQKRRAWGGRGFMQADVKKRNHFKSFVSPVGTLPYNGCWWYLWQELSLPIGGTRN